MTEPTNQHPAPVHDLKARPIRLPAPDAAEPPAPSQRVPPRSRAGGLWGVVVTFAPVLLLLVIFILQNGARSDVHYLGAHGHLPMGLALLLAAIFGMLVVAVPMGVRIAQLRRVAARRRGRMSTPARKRADS
jgi:uncharacterized integral membrane protein